MRLKNSQIRKLYEKVASRLNQNFLVATNGFLLISWFLCSFLVFFFERNIESSNIKSISQALWWGIVTLLTVGYGDYYPVSDYGKLSAVLLMTAGVVFVSLVTAKISSMFLEKALFTRSGDVDTESIQDHIIVCGWKEDISQLLLHILTANPDIGSDHLVLISETDPLEVASLKAEKKLNGLKFIKGAFYQEMYLKRSAPDRARKIIILADRTPASSGTALTLTEVDARTIMTAMTLNNIAKGVPIVAEVLDSSMDQYLKLANVNEIVYSRDYSRLLLGKASQGMGITNIIYDLLTEKNGANLTTIEVPASCINQTYAELKEHMKNEKPRAILLGLLENSGNSHHTKQQALRRAQMTPNVEDLVNNLRSIKKLRFNQPLFNPLDTHIINAGALAMVIEHSEDHRGRLAS